MTSAKKAILGLAPAATSHYYNQIQKKIRAEGKSDTAQYISIFNTDFEYINQFLPDNYTKISESILPYFSKIEDSKTRHLLIPNITLHEHVDKLMAEHRKYSFSISHPLELTVQFLQRNKIRRVYILGTMYTMNNPYITDYLKKHRIDIVPMSHQLQERTEQLRIANQDGNQDPDFLANIISKLDDFINPILACTELSTLNTDNSIIDMAALQIEHFMSL